MGHQISKQQNQQMSDDQQLTSSIETHTDPSTSEKDLQVKINKNTRLFTSNAKKLKKQQKYQQSDVNSKIKTKSKSKVKVNANTRLTTNCAVVTEGAETSTATTTNQDRNAGSVVITIRLLKMESTRGFEVNSVDNEFTPFDRYANNNIIDDSSSSSNNKNSHNNKINHNNNNNVNSNSNDKNRSKTQFQAYNSDDAHLNSNLYMPGNSLKIQNNSFNMDNSNMSVRQVKTEALTASGTYENGNNERNSVRKSHVNRALRSEATICDNIPINCTSQTEQQSAVLSDCLAHSFNEIRLTETTAVPVTSMAAAVAAVPIAADHKSTMSIQSNTTTSAFIPTNLINTVSPYPHHIPIANIIRSDCFNGIVDEYSTICQHAKKVCSSCGVSGGSNGAIVSVTKQNGANKESKELKSKKPNWGIKLNCTKLKGIKSLSSSLSSEPSSPSSPPANPTTINTSDNMNTDSKIIANNATITTANVSAQQSTALLCTSGGNVIIVTTDQQQPWFASDEYSIEDCDKKSHLQRAIEIAENVEPTPPGFISTSNLKSLHSMSSSNLQLLPGTVANAAKDPNGRTAVPKTSINSPQQWTMVCSNSPTLRIMLPGLLPHPEDMPRIHSQVDYVHCLVPDLMQITNCSFYWGKMDRYEAERLLDNKPEGTFLLRDSAQEEFLFSVSFRKYGRSLHARIEQFNHKFSFDCHDANVYTSRTVTGLLEHYKDPGCVMFFEPALTIPLNRDYVFSLQQLCRATIVSHTTYDGINEICLPKKLKSYLKEYHYKQNVRVKRFDEQIYGTS